MMKARKLSKLRAFFMFGVGFDRRCNKGCNKLFAAPVGDCARQSDDLALAQTDPQLADLLAVGRPGQRHVLVEGVGAGPVGHPLEHVLARAIGHTQADEAAPEVVDPPAAKAEAIEVIVEFPKRVVGVPVAPLARGDDEVVWAGRPSQRAFPASELPRSEDLRQRRVDRLETLRSYFRLARELMDARKAKGLSQLQLASRSGLHQSEISDIERGRANPTFQTLAKLARHLGGRIGLVAATRGGISAKRAPHALRGAERGRASAFAAKRA